MFFQTTMAVSLGQMVDGVRKETLIETAARHCAEIGGLDLAPGARVNVGNFHWEPDSPRVFVLEAVMIGSRATELIVKVARRGTPFNAVKVCYVQTSNVSQHCIALSSRGIPATVLNAPIEVRQR